MADLEQLTDPASGVDAETRQIVRLFRSDRAGAVALLRQVLPEQKPAGTVLQQLNKLGRSDIVLTVEEFAVFDGKTPGLIVVEYARALAQGTTASRAEQFLNRMAPMRGRDYAFHYAAGRMMAELRQPARALEFYENAFLIKPTPQAAERVFQSHLMLERYDDAAVALGRILRSGNFQDSLGKDVLFLLDHVAPGDLDPELAYSLASIPGADDILGASLVPHLVAADLLDCVLALADRDVAKLGGWNEAALMSAVPYLADAGEYDHLLRLHQRYGQSSDAVAAAFTRILESLPTAQMTRFLVPDLTGFDEDASSSADFESYLAISEIFASTAHGEDALEMVRLLPRIIAPDDAERFYAREKHRLARLAQFVAGKLAPEPGAMGTIGRFIAFWAELAVRTFFSGPDYDELIAAVCASRRLADAPAGSRQARMREDYFGFHLERRTDATIDETANDFELCAAALAYFAAMSEQRPAASIPVGRALSQRLGKPALAMDAAAPLSALAAYAMIQDRSKLDLGRHGAFDDFCWWYLTALVGARKIPAECQPPHVVSFLNQVVSKDDFHGLDVTRFLKLVWTNSSVYQSSFDLGNFIDRLLIAANLVAAVLSRNTQFLPMFLPFFQAEEGQSNLLDWVIAALAETNGADERPRLSEAASGSLRPRRSARISAAPQDVLVIGHASKDSGLGRNFGMLAKALDTGDIALHRLDYDLKADAASAALNRWFGACRTEPIVVFAVNAQDVAEFFARDRNGVLFDCYNVGFFLWEVSRIPAVQELGVALVNEVWAPTAYVADIYAPHAPTHVVGKGIFRGDEAYLSEPRRPGKSPGFTFVTVFDFDSSIERKNPLAVVQAFRAAFGAGEDVELIVKTSNVNPLHWSNVLRHWERVLEASRGDKRIKLVTDRYSNAEMTTLVRDADCVVSLHRSEGFGYLMSDAMAFGTPVIATDYSGNVDFCNADTAFPVAYRLVPIPHWAARWRCEGAEWADIDAADAARQMRHVFENRDKARDVAALARRRIADQYSLGNFRASLAARIAAIRNR